MSRPGALIDEAPDMLKLPDRFTRKSPPADPVEPAEMLLLFTVKSLPTISTLSVGLPLASMLLSEMLIERPSTCRRGLDIPCPPGFNAELLVTERSCSREPGAADAAFP